LKQPTHLKGQFACHGRYRRWVGYCIAGGLVLLVAAGFYLTRPQRLAGFAQSILQNATGAAVHIESASLDWNGTLQLHHLTMTLPGDDTDAGRLFDVNRAQMTQDLWSLMSGRFRATSITLIQPTVHVVKDPATDSYNFQRLPGKESQEPPGPPPTMPTIYLRDGRLAFATTDARGQTTDIGSVYLSGSLQAHGRVATTYTLQLREDRAAGETGLTIAGQYDLEQRALQGTLTDFHFDGVIRDALPARVLDVWTNLDPQGSIPLLHFSHSPDTGLAVELQLQDMALRVAHGKIDERLRHTSGTFIFRDDRLTIDNLTGELLGSAIALDGWVMTDTGRMTNLLDRATGDLTLNVTNFHIPRDKQPFAESLPGIVRRNLERFDPAGRVDVMIHLTREQDSATPGKLATRVEGHADLVDISARYFRFPYRAHDVRGRVRFSNDAVHLEGITGVGETGGRVELSGIIEPPGDSALVDILVTATDVPVDEHLLAALEEKHRKGVEDLLDRERYAALRDAGRLQSSADHAAAVESLRAMETGAAPDAAAVEALRDEVAIPVFDLGGRVDAVARIHRPVGPAQKYTTTVDIDPVGLSAIYDNWKYPVRITGGKLRIDRAVYVQGVTFEGMSGATIHADGIIDSPNDLDVGDTMLTLRADRVPLDDWLRDTINDAGRNWLDVLQLDTPLAMVCRTYVTEDRKVAFKVDVDFEGGTAEPWSKGYKLTDVRGKATIERDLLTLHELRGKHDDAGVILSGRVQWSDEQPAADITLKGENVAIDPRLLAMCEAIDSGAAALTQMRDKYDAQGTFDVSVDYTIKPDGSNARQIAVMPRTLKLLVAQTPVQFTDMAGTLRLVGPGAVLDNVAGTLDGGRLTAKGQVTWLPETQADVKLDFADGTMSPAVRALLPQAAQAVIDGMEIGGGVSLTDGHLRISEHDTGNAIRFDGKVGFRDATAAVGVPADHINGTLTVAIEREADAAMPTMKLDLAADAMRVADRQITRLVAAMSTTEDRKTLKLGKLEGEIYGGRLVGGGAMDLAGDRRLHMEMNIQDAAFEPFIAAGGKKSADGNMTPTEAEAALVPPGTLTAGLTFEAVPGDVASRRGRGLLRVQNARIYDLPLVLGMLQIANLTLPTSRAFDRMQATYLLEGDVLTIENAELTATNVALIGAGHVRLSDRRIDLAFVSRNPDSGLDLGPIGDLLHGIKDELVTIHLTGTVSDPTIGLDSFRRVRESWSSIFTQKKASTEK
jgi:hypothetical protein